jgi:cellulase/cellobiase CelA1
VQLVTIGRNQFYVRARDAAGNVSLAAGPITVEGTSLPPTTMPPPRTCRVAYATQSQWTGGFVASVTVHNTGTAPVDGWTLGFSFAGDQRIASLWGGVHTQTGAAVTVRDAGWNSMIAPGGSASFGLQGAWTASNAPPGAFTLNGAPCTP